MSTAAASVDVDLVAPSFVLSGWLIGDDLRATALVAGHHPVEILVFSGVGVEVGRSIQIRCQFLAEARAAVDAQRTTGAEKVSVVEFVVVRSSTASQLIRIAVPSQAYVTVDECRACLRLVCPDCHCQSPSIPPGCRQPPSRSFRLHWVGMEVSGTNNIGCQLFAETRAAVCTQRTTGVEKLS